ncbi:MAG TPA: DUF1223 domain-containing protein [Terriglobales bacterium]|nr:DUF1223 domain-containing protein [Terriglobales bacterium]
MCNWSSGPSSRALLIFGLVLIFISIPLQNASTETASGAETADGGSPPISPGANPQAGGNATATDASSADAHPVVVELFTSEGCSSCPPADAFLEKLDAGQPLPGAKLIVLSEHVDYWDHDGWKDPNSSALLTERQDSYERALGESTPYTPQLIVDGTSEMHLGDAQQVETTLRKAATTPKVAVRITDVKIDGGADAGIVRAHVDTDVNSGPRNADVYAVVALNRVESQVLRGENGGRHLTHVAVVQQLTKIGKLAKGKAFSQDIQLKLKPGTDPANIRLVVFVQEPGPGRVLGAGMRKPAA